MRSKVLYVNPTGDMYGASRCLLRLIISLDKDAYEPLVVVPEEGPFVDTLREYGVSVQVLSHMPVIRRRVFRSWLFIPFVLSIIPFVLSLCWMIRRNRVNLVHSNSGVIFAAAIAARLSNIPHVWHLREMFAGEFGYLWQHYRTLMLKLSDKIVCVSTPIAEQFPRTPLVEVVYDGFDMAHFNINKDEVEELRKKYWSGLTSKVVGVVGRISPRKGQDVILQACAILKREGFHDIRCLIVGDIFEGNEQTLANIKAFVVDNGMTEHVVFTGYVDDPKPLIASLDILVLPSILPEAFPGVVIEGMALSVPVIATKTGGTIEQIKDGHNGLLIPPNDPAALADAIKVLLNDPKLAARMGKAGKKQVETRFSLENMCGQVEALYSRLLDGNALMSMERI